MEKEFMQKDIDAAVDKKAEAMKLEHQKQLDAKDAEVAKAQKNLEDSEKTLKESQKEIETAKEKEAEVIKQKKEAEEALEKTKKEALEKQKMADEGGAPGSKLGGKTLTSEEMNKAFADGQVPIMRG